MKWEAQQSFMAVIKVNIRLTRGVGAKMGIQGRESQADRDGNSRNSIKFKGLETVPDPIYQRYSFAHGLIREAGALALGYFNELGSLTVKSKGLQDVVSEADLQTELLIKKLIAGAYPEDAFF